MAWPRTTPAQIRDRVASEMEVEIGGSDPRARRSVEGAMTRGLALASHEMHGHIEWVFLQRFVDTAEAEYLERHGALARPVVTRRAALLATGAVVFSGTVGTVVPEGTELRRADDGRFVTLADAEIGGGGSVEAAVVAVDLTPAAGAAGNTAAAVKLALIAPLAGVRSQATVVAAGISGGADVEGDASLRARILQRLQEDADGGSDSDWKAWVQDVVGKTRVWVYPLHMGPGTVGVTFIMPDGSIPDAGTLEAVEAYLQVVKPVTAHLYLFAPVVLPVDLEIELSPDTVAVRELVEAEAADFFIREAEPGGTAPLSRLSASISSASGQYSHKLIAPVESIVSPPGNIARLGVIAWAAP